MASTVYHKEIVRQYVGQLVHCHSVYGHHEGLVHRALHDGFILVHHVQLAGGEQMTPEDIQAEAHNDSQDDGDMTTVQFFLPAPGLFVPYGGLYGLWPRPGFII